MLQKNLSIYFLDSCKNLKLNYNLHKKFGTLNMDIVLQTKHKAVIKGESRGVSTPLLVYRMYKSVGLI